MKKLGLDLGSSSIGWTLRENNTFEKKGVITFQSGMLKGQSGGYSSPTEDRRKARSKRKLIQARKYRKWELLKVMLDKFVPLNNIELESWSKYKKGAIRKFPENANFLKWLKCDFSYIGVSTKYNNPYELRVKAVSKNLEDKLHNHEFGRALYHLVQRRGYKNIGENEDEDFDAELAKKDSETKTQLERREKDGFKAALDKHETIAVALKKEFLDKELRARNQYPLRKEYRDELEKMCKAQGYDISKNDKGNYNDAFVQKLWKAIIWQRPLKIQKGSVGKCTLEPNNPRCPISHPVYEIFRAWSFINTIKYYNSNGKKVRLENCERNLLFEFFLKKDKNFKFEEIKSFLNKHFGLDKKYNYPINKEGMYDTSVSGMPVCNGLIKIFGHTAQQAILNIATTDKEVISEKIKISFKKYAVKRNLDEVAEINIEKAIQNDIINNAPKIINGYSIYDLWHILFSFDEKTATNRKFLEKFAVENLSIQNIKPKKGQEYNPFNRLKYNITRGYADLSLKAISKMLPFLKEGYMYNEAVIMAKIPELMGAKWEQEQKKIKNIVLESNEIYNEQKAICEITNKLIDQYKGLENDEKFAFKDFEYVLEDSDRKAIEKVCQGYFGEKSWAEKVENEKSRILYSVRENYQAFFHDLKRTYRTIPLLTNLFKEKLAENKIEMNGTLYHHSNIENRYLKKYINSDTGMVSLPVYIDKNTGVITEILPEGRIDSIKNPMFNKSMSILRKLINTLIKEGSIDKETEVIIEVARELNDNNKRAAIERFQNDRRNNREKYRSFLEEYKEKQQRNINIEEGIGVFELWVEQTYEETKDENGKKVTNKNTVEILKEKDALRRYELWMEQKGQCMYTGKMISISQLFSNEIEIAHTIPRSLLPDNTMANMTVAYARYNRDIQKTKTPFYCENYWKDIEGVGTAILPRLDTWIQLRDNWKSRYEKAVKSYGTEDEAKKNRRIQEKHYCKIYYEYWHDKIERFNAEEIKDSWVRRQLVDTQMISKYAREYLKTYFNKVAVQKGNVTADFRKIYGFQEEDEIKSRNKYTHHAIDAAVLTLIPTNSSHREKILKEYYEALEIYSEMPNRKPFEGFNSQMLIQDIENKTLIVNYENDKILKQSYKNIRKRGKLQYLKDSNGKFVLNKDEKKILLKAKGDTVRSTLYAQTYLAKIRDVERYDDGQPKRYEGDWLYKKEEEEFLFVKRESIDKVKASDKLIDAIVDPVIKKLVGEQKREIEIKDYQNKIIRHVRVKASTGKKIKQRVNYLSKYDYKNNFYSESGSIPYAILLQKSDNGKVEREIIPVASFELAKAYKNHGSFLIDEYLKKIDAEDGTEWLNGYSDKKLLKVGQKVLVLNEDTEYKSRYKNDFQSNRLYIITQFSDVDNTIMLKYHLEAQADDKIDDFVKGEKDKLLRKYEIASGIPEVIEDSSIENVGKRRDKYLKDRYKLKSFKDYRFKRLIEVIGLDKVREIKNELGNFKTYSSSIGIEGKTPLLKMTKENWNFLYEGIDFEMTLLGKIKWISND